MAHIDELTQPQLDELEGKVTELEKFKNESAPQLEEYKKAKESLDALKKENEDLKGQANPNWKAARDRMEKLEALLKGKGVEVDETGNPKGGSGQGLSVEDVRKESVEATRKELLGSRLEELLDDYDTDSKEVVRHYFTKLTAGEQVDMKNIKKFVLQAENAANAGEKKVKRDFSGQGPRAVDSQEKLSEESMKGLGTKMGLPFVNPKK